MAIHLHIDPLPPPAPDRECRCGPGYTCENDRAWRQGRALAETPPAPVAPARGRSGPPPSPSRAAVLAALAEHGPLSTDELLSHVEVGRTALANILRGMGRSGVLARTPERHQGAAMWWLPHQAPPTILTARRAPVRADPLAPRNGSEWTLARTLMAFQAAMFTRQRPLSAHEINTGGYGTPSLRACKRLLVRLGFPEDISLRQAQEMLQVWAVTIPEPPRDRGKGEE
jgi:hypothetical protein